MIPMHRLMLAAVAGLMTTGLVSPQGGAQPSYDPITFSLLDPKGLQFVINNGRTPRKHQPETMVAGVALLDYDRDGLLDIYAVNGATMPGLEKKDGSFFNRLFRNVGDGSFEDVTERAGVRGRGYNLGVATGDYDNDGDTDLFVAGLRENILYRNNGNGTIADVTASGGLAHRDPEYGTLWAVAAAWLDYDRDGWLDLFVSNYCVWDPDTEPICPINNLPDYCHPKLYRGLPNSLFRNNGDGTFTDISAGESRSPTRST